MEPIVPNQKLEPGVFQGSPQVPQTKKSVPARVIRTMKSDASEAIRNNEETTVSIAIAEQKKQAQKQAEALAEKAAHPEAVPPAPKPIGRFIVIIIIFVGIALLGLAYVFIVPKLKAIKLPSISFPSFGKSAPTSIATTTMPATPVLENSIITADSEIKFNITSQPLDQVLPAITAERQLGVAIGFIKNIYFSQDNAGQSAPISANRLFMFAGIAAPEILTRSLDKTFMAGFIGEQNNVATPFVILKVSANDTGLAGMLAWEPTLPSLFNTLFGTTISGTKGVAAKFNDVLVLGKDARAYNTPSGDTIEYAFANPTTIVITNTQSALETLLPIAATK